MSFTFRPPPPPQHGAWLDNGEPNGPYPGQTLLSSVSETATASDSGNRQAGYLRAPTETALVSDVAAGVRGLIRVASETATTVDNAIRSVVYGRSPSETATTVDSGNRAAIYTRQQAETDTATDTATGQHGLVRSGTEATATTDSDARQAGYSRQQSETDVTSDTPATQRGVIRQALETVTTSDSVKRVVGYVRAITSEIASAIDSISDVWTPYPYPRLLQSGAGTNTSSSSTNVTVSATTAGSLFLVGLVDPIDADADTAPKLGGTSLNSGDGSTWNSGSGSEFVYWMLPSAGQTSLTIPGDSSYIYEEWSPGTGAWVTGGLLPLDKHVSAQAVSAGTSAASGSTGTLSISNEMVFTFVGAPNGNTIHTVPSGYTLDQSWSGSGAMAGMASVRRSSTTAQNPTWVLTLSTLWVSSTLTFEFNPSSNHILAVVETVLTSDTANRFVGYLRAATDVSAVTDAVLSPVAHIRQAIETVLTSDLAQSIRGVVRGANETATTTDSDTRQVQMSRQQQETATTTDSGNRLQRLARSLSETAQTTDTIFGARVVLAIAAEIVTTVDTIARFAGYGRSGNETATTSDTPSRRATMTRALAEVTHVTDLANAGHRVLLTLSDVLHFEDGPDSWVRSLSDTLPSFSDAIAVVRHVYLRLKQYLPATSDSIAPSRRIPLDIGEENPDTDND